MSNQTQIGFIGLGKMGWPMAKRLVEAGYSLQVLEADQGRCAEFVAQVGGVACTSAKTLAQATNVIITILPTSAIVQSVLEGPDGVLAGLQPNTVLVEMSSGVPSITRHLAQLVSQAGGHLVDAPVSGGVPRAKTGELSIMFGGSNDQLSTLTPILQCMGQAIEPTGDVGSAHAMKALNNLVSAGGFLIGVEALMIGKRFGLSPEKMVDVLNASTGMNNSTQKKFKQFVLSGQFNSGFGLDLMVKDLSIALGIAHETATPTPFSALCRELWAASAQMLGPNQDHTAVAKLTERLAGDSLSRSEGKK
jgi:3-hydroxyisobutyrate dehydrogenase|uniref:NAD(P)-dependent oxidoreductase n=1 Tax=Orrella sp. TaxID=1921583 RepID=UPI0040483B9A